ncbi:hypothetical protein BRC64_07960 [Halobacteriales archaeon QH_10_67_22]|nr:MAG: hypothetical protein BRC64_07960 [Halobacteriales archaeon QH_10_67_22]
MDVDRKTVVELAVSAFIIVAFTAGVFFVSRVYADPDNATTNSSIPPSILPDGGLALVGTIGVFVLLVAGIGLFMYSQDFDED